VQRLHGYRAVAGLYWDTYPIFFDSARAIEPVTYPADVDYHHHREHASAPWAAVLSPLSQEFMQPALASFGITGRTERFGTKTLLLPDARFANDATLPLRVADDAERRWRASLSDSPRP